MLKALAILLNIAPAPALNDGQTFAKPTVPAEVTVSESGAGWRFADAKGMTLYTYERDTVPGASACQGECAKVWPPLLAPANAGPVGDWTILVRDVRSRQWAYKGHPLYAYSIDPHPGATFGETVLLQGDFRFNNVGSGAVAPWHAAFEPIPIPPEVTIVPTAQGRVLADAKSMTLYTFDGDGDRSKCNGKCLQTWRPLLAPSIATASGAWSLTPRADGKLQWSYRGKPLYTFRAELRPGEMSGDGADKLWHAVLLEPGPARPAWVTVHDSDLGPVLADADGMTLYTTPKDGSWNVERMRQTTCKDEDCMRVHWRPVLVKPSEPEAVGNWSTVTRADGKKQWALEGYPVYVFVDAPPGDVIRGEHYGSGSAQQAGFRAILQSGLVRR